MSAPAMRTDLPVEGKPLARRSASGSGHRREVDNPSEKEGIGTAQGATLERGVFDLVRAFVDQLPAEGLHTAAGQRATWIIDWEAVYASAADSHSLEHAAGRAVLEALRQRAIAAGAEGPHDAAERFEPTDNADAWQVRADDPFFAFSVADRVPDFGGENRYRSRVGRGVARIVRLGKRPDGD